MSERCIVRIKFTPAGTAGEVRRAVGGFLRYVQHRDIHPESKPSQPRHEIAGLLKYVSYRDRANTRAELFGPAGPIGTRERKDFADFIACSLQNSRPELFRTHDGRVRDRRRAVSRLIISPEQAAGLDLKALTDAAISRLESELGTNRLRWIAAIHRNTKHHHVHLVVAGMVEDGQGGYRRADVTKPRLAAMKEAVALEIERQRAERQPVPQSELQRPGNSGGSVASVIDMRAALPAFARPQQVRLLIRRRLAISSTAKGSRRYGTTAGSLLTLRAVARRYSRQMEREVEREAWRFGRERAA